jgi:predicted transcriptional regulator
MKFSDVMIHFEYKQNLIAEFLGISRSAVWVWKKNNHIPYFRQWQLEVLTKGALKAEKEPNNL